MDYITLGRPPKLLISHNSISGHIMWKGLTHGLYDAAKGEARIWLTSEAGKTLEKINGAWEWQPDQDKLNDKMHAVRIYGDKFYIYGATPIGALQRLPEDDDYMLPDGIEFDDPKGSADEFCSFEYQNDKYILIWDKSYRAVIDELVYVYAWCSGRN